MNICQRYECNTCGTKIDCRIGMSNRDIQPFQFACPNCEERISFTFGNENMELQGATEVDLEGPFQGNNPFVDLHLDFPVYWGKYELGMTTFMRVTQEIGMHAYHHLNNRLTILNKLHTLHNELRSIITQYNRGDLNSFEKACIRIPGVKLESRKQQDVLAALYSATSIMSSPFTIHENNSELSKEAPRMLEWLHANHSAMTLKFFDQLLDNGFLKNLHKDCLSLYPKLISMDLPFRPAFFYD